MLGRFINFMKSDEIEVLFVRVKGKLVIKHERRARFSCPYCFKSYIRNMVRDTLKTHCTHCLANQLADVNAKPELGDGVANAVQTINPPNDIFPNGVWE